MIEISVALHEMRTILRFEIVTAETMKFTGF
jgi:hypothetical protein